MGKIHLAAFTITTCLALVFAPFEGYKLQPSPQNIISWFRSLRHWIQPAVQRALIALASHTIVPSLPTHFVCPCYVTVLSQRRAHLLFLYVCIFFLQQTAWFILSTIKPLFKYPCHLLSRIAQYKRIRSFAKQPMIWKCSFLDDADLKSKA